MNHFRLLHAALAGATLVLAACGASAAPATRSAGPGAGSPAAASAPAASKPSSANPAASASAKPAPSSVASANPAASGSASAAANLTSIKVGVLGVTSDAAIYLAQDKGYFAEQGLKVDTQRFNSGGDMVVPLAQGDLAAGAGATSAGFYNAILRGIQIKIVADKGTILPDWNYVTLMVRKDLYDSGALHDYKDLKGKKIAITAPESSNAIQLDAAMRKGGATLKDAQTVILGFADMGAAFSNKSIDAGIVSEPFITRYKETNLAVNLGGVADFYPPGQETAIIMYSPRFAAEEATAIRFMTAYIQGARDYNDAFTKNKGKDQVIGILAKDTTVTQPDLWNRMALAAINPNGEVDAKSLQRDLDWYESEGNVKGKVDLSGIIDTHFAKAVVDKLGRYS